MQMFNVQDYGITSFLTSRKPKGTDIYIVHNNAIIIVNLCVVCTVRRGTQRTRMVISKDTPVLQSPEPENVGKR